MYTPGVPRLILRNPAFAAIANLRDNTPHSTKPTGYSIPRVPVCILLVEKQQQTLFFLSDGKDTDFSVRDGSSSGPARHEVTGELAVCRAGSTTSLATSRVPIRWRDRLVTDARTKSLAPPQKAASCVTTRTQYDGVTRRWRPSGDPPAAAQRPQTWPRLPALAWCLSAASSLKGSLLRPPWAHIGLYPCHLSRGACRWGMPHWCNGAPPGMHTIAHTRRYPPRPARARARP